MNIEVRNLQKQFGNLMILNGIDVSIPSGSFTVIMGRSGEGKSVFLKHLIGLMSPTAGSIYCDGVDITQSESRDRERVLKKCGYVFQLAALFDSLTVFENVGITLIEQGMPIAAVEAIVKEKLMLVGLDPDIMTRYPAELSGGMRKRVGCARALVPDPLVMLYDEPTTGLDRITARLIHELMKTMQQRFSVTTIAVSHDIDILHFADYVMLLHEGRVRFFGPSTEVWDESNPYMYQFVQGNLHGPLGRAASLL